MPSFEWSEWISTTDLLFLAGLMLAVMAMMRMARLRSTRHETPYRPVIDRAAMLAQLKPMPEPEQETPVSSPASSALDTRAVEILQRLENRVRTLEELLRAADRKIVELNALLKQNDPPRPPAKSRAVERPQPTSAHHQAEGLARSRDFSSMANAAVTADSRRTTARYQAVYKLLDQGESAAAVARQLGFPVGEVELIAGLRG